MPIAPLASRHLALALATLAPLALAACEKAPRVAGARVFAADLAGKAKSCSAEDVSPGSGSTTQASMTLGNDGGWCGISASQGGRPYQAGLVQKRAQHGHVFIHTVGDATRVDYTPDAGFTGNDSFAVRLLPGNATLDVAVTVTPR
jgi:hypothetical protein